ncbi:conserved hypothetical protein [Parafrankia sp. Ea1.12]|nr:conserved hypothetical protein [Parafrankia sp. Ea1.12]
MRSPEAREPSGIVGPLAGVAQLVAHSTCNRAARGSSPLAGSRQMAPDLRFCKVGDHLLKIKTGWCAHGARIRQFCAGNDHEWDVALGLLSRICGRDIAS